MTMTRQEIARLGGLASMANKTPDERSEFGGIGGEARAASLTPERRSEIARIAANARWARVGSRLPSKGFGWSEE